MYVLVYLLIRGCIIVYMPLSSDRRDRKIVLQVRHIYKKE